MKKPFNISTFDNNSEINPSKLKFTVCECECVLKKKPHRSHLIEVIHKTCLTHVKTTKSACLRRGKTQQNETEKKKKQNFGLFSRDSFFVNTNR